MADRIVYAVERMERLIDDQALSRERLISALRMQMNELRSGLRQHGIDIDSRVRRRNDKAEIIAMSRDGMAQSEIARRVSLTRQRVSQILIEAGLNKRRR